MNDDDHIKTCATAMQGLKVLPVTYDRRPHMEHITTMASLQTLAAFCRKLRFLTISVNAAESPPLPKPIIPFTNIKSLCVAAFPSRAKDYEMYAEELAALCPNIRRFRIGQREGCKAEEFERQSKRVLVSQFWSAVEDSFQAIGGGGEVFAEARRTMMVQALLSWFRYRNSWIG